jgi:tRNA 2-selenouridine synthase
LLPEFTTVLSIFTIMVRELAINDFFSHSSPLIDVRSPGEYSKGHIPGAVNIPLFSDAERARIGTVYVKVSQEKATQLAFEYVKPKLDEFIIQSKKAAPDGRVTIHCWRGGMRSSMFAQHLAGKGFSDVSILLGGYKSFRNHVLNSFSKPLNFHIIGGYTGSGKTYIIRELRKYGNQVIDLEKLARHKGSAFGHIGQNNQPSSEQFENELFEVWRKLDEKKPVWLEDESRNIGGVNIPMAVYNQMRNAPLLFLHIPKEERARHLVKEYTGSDPGLLSESIRKLTRRLGGLNTSKALQLIDEGNFFEAAIITLGYYDKAYLKGLSYRNKDTIMDVNMNDVDPVVNTRTILEIIKQNG